MEDYDSLSADEQNARRQEWDKVMEEKLSALDLEKEFEHAGVSWVESDVAGNVVFRR